MTIWRMRIACWIIKATSTLSEYVILIAFALQQWLQERASLLRLTYSSVYGWSWMSYAFFSSFTAFFRKMWTNAFESQKLNLLVTTVCRTADGWCSHVIQHQVQWSVSPGIQLSDRVCVCDKVKWPSGLIKLARLWNICLQLPSFSLSPC